MAAMHLVLERHPETDGAAIRVDSLLYPGDIQFSHRNTYVLDSERGPLGPAEYAVTIDDVEFVDDDVHLTVSLHYSSDGERLETTSHELLGQPDGLGGWIVTPVLVTEGPHAGEPVVIYSSGRQVR